MILFDTAGQEDYASLRPMMHNIANIFVICFNVDNESSFRNIQNVWLPEASGFNKTASIVICACKVDLRYDQLRDKV